MTLIPTGPLLSCFLLEVKTIKRSRENKKLELIRATHPIRTFGLLPLALQLGSGILEGYVHFLSILVLEAPQCREGDRRFVERKRKGGNVI